MGIPVLAHAIGRTSATCPQSVRLLSPFHSFMSRYTLSVSAQMFPWNTIMYWRIIRHQTLPHDHRHLWTTCWKVWIRNNRQTIMVHQPTLPTKVPSAATKIISCTGTVKIYQKLLQHLLFLYNAPPWASWLRQPIYTTFMFIPTL